MVGDVFFTALFDGLSTVYTWLSTHDAVSWGNFHITWFETDIGFLLFTFLISFAISYRQQILGGEQDD